MFAIEELQETGEWLQWPFQYETLEEAESQIEFDPELEYKIIDLDKRAEEEQQALENFQDQDRLKAKYYTNKYGD